MNDQSNNETSSSNPKILLRSKIAEKRISRSSKKIKEHTLEKTLKDLGIDKEKFKQDLAAVQSRGKVMIQNSG